MNSVKVWRFSREHLNIMKGHRGRKVVQKMEIFPYSMYVLTNSYYCFTRYTFDGSCTECSLKLQGWKLHNQCHIISTYTRIIRTYRFSLGADSSNVHLESDQTLTSDDAPPHCALKMSFTWIFLQKQIPRAEVKSEVILIELLYFFSIFGKSMPICLTQRWFYQSINPKKEFIFNLMSA